MKNYILTLVVLCLSLSGFNQATAARKAATPVDVVTQEAQQADEWLITGVYLVAHYNGDGNLSAGDTVEKDDHGNYIKTEKVAIHYAALLAGNVVLTSHVIVENKKLLTLLSSNPAAYAEIKSTANAALTLMGIAPADAKTY